jgi:hypothetical protein
MNIAEGTLVISHGVHEQSKFAGIIKINEDKLKLCIKNFVTKIRPKSTETTTRLLTPGYTMGTLSIYFFTAEIVTCLAKHEERCTLPLLAQRIPDKLLPKLLQNSNPPPPNLSQFVSWCFFNGKLFLASAHRFLFSVQY